MLFLFSLLTGHPINMAIVNYYHGGVNKKIGREGS